MSTTTLYNGGTAPTSTNDPEPQVYHANPPSSPEPTNEPSPPENQNVSPAPSQAPPAPRPQPLQQESTPQEPAPSDPAPVQVTPPDSNPAPAKPPAGSKTGPGFGAAISYSPYNTDHSCKSASQVKADFSIIEGFELVRLYGTDCDQVSNVIAAIQGTNIKLFLGIFNINDVNNEAQTIIKAVDHKWDLVNTVSVGNELVNSGQASVGQVTSAIETARSCLKDAGYNGPIVTVDTMVAMKEHPELCRASDFCAINCHAFFDGKVLPENAGDFVLGWVQQVSEAAGGKTTVVTETGWPSQGSPNQQAIPSPQNHQKAIQSIKQSFSNNAILYSAFNDLWKSNSAATFGAEQYWGIYGNSPH